MAEDAPLVRVLIVDDTVMYRRIMDKAVSSLEGTQIVASVSSGELALKRLAISEIDLVLLDVFMPGMDGVETLKQIRQNFPQVDVVMVSGVATNDADVTIQALNLGAIDFIPKPKEDNAEAAMKVLTQNLQHVMKEVRIRAYKRPSSPAAVAKPAPPKPAAPIPTPRPSIKPAKFDLIVIGVSTGGPNALGVVIPALPADLRCPVLLVQHMPPMFTASLAEHLSKRSALKVREAVEGETVLPGTVWVAPGGKHMVVRRDAAKGLVIGLNEQAPVNSCRPAVDVLFRSVAATVNSGVLAVILTGMGEDGAAGVAALKRKSCYCLAQDEKTCVVYGMPRAVVEQGLADEVLPLESVAPKITALVRG